MPVASNDNVANASGFKEPVEKTTLSFPYRRIQLRVNDGSLYVALCLVFA